MSVFNSPTRRVLLGRFQAARRRRFYATIRGQWDHAATGSLVGRFRGLGVPPSRESLEQVPHWMFTFVLSGTDLLTRTLALIGSRPEVLRRARAEIDAAGRLGEAATIEELAYVEACVREAGRLFAPVTGTSHAAPRGADLNGHRIPAGMRILHYFPMTQRNTAMDPTADDFVPERWLDPQSDAFRLYPNLFLSGSRECPGRDLIMFLCKSAIAIQVGRHGVRVEASSLRSDPLPYSFPKRQLRFVRS
jgi:cytochrome P450